MSVTLSDYFGQGEFGVAGEDNGELLKAMQAGQITGRETTDASGTYEPLKLESLERTLKSLEFRQKDIKLWNAITKSPAYNTVEEFAQLLSYGSTAGGFYQEGELADVVDSEYTRKAEKVKYLQQSGEVTLQAQMVRTLTDAMRQEIENKMMRISGLVNKYLTHADERFVPDQFNSIYAQHSDIGGLSANLYTSWDQYYNSEVVVDLRGRTLTQEDIEEGSVRVDGNYGITDTLYGPTSVISGISRDYYEKQRILLGANGTKTTGGMNVKTISTTLGDVDLNADKFMKQNPPRRTSSLPTSLKAPLAPTAGTAPAVVADPLSKYVTGDAGDVFYAVASENRYGESSLTVLGTAAVAITPGSSINLTFTPTSGGTTNPSCYVIYRSKVISAGATSATVEFFPLFRISTADLTNGSHGAAAGSTRDRGNILPDTEQAFAGSISDEVLCFKQLAPISKLDLAVNGPSRKFMIFLYGTPQLFTPKKLIRYINIGTKYVG
mgnify:CR=1 FL=1